MAYPNRSSGVRSRIAGTSAEVRRHGRRSKRTFAAAIALCVIADLVIVVSAAFLSQTDSDLAATVAIGLGLLAWAGREASRSGFGLLGAVAAPGLPFLLVVVLGMSDMSTLTLGKLSQVLAVVAAAWAAELVPVLAGYGLARLPGWVRRRRASEALGAPVPPGLGLAQPAGLPKPVPRPHTGEIQGGPPLTGWNARIAEWYVTGPPVLLAVVCVAAIIVGFLVLAALSSVQGLPAFGPGLAIVLLVIVVPIGAVYAIAGMARVLLRMLRRS